MSGAEWVAIIAALGGVVIAILNARTANRRTDLMWESKKRAAEVAAINSGIATKDSPFTLGAEIVDAFEKSGIAEELREFYLQHGIGLGDSAFLEKIEGRFGERMLTLIAKPMKLEHDACTIAAMHVARSGSANELLEGAEVQGPPQANSMDRIFGNRETPFEEKRSPAATTAQKEGVDVSVLAAKATESAAAATHVAAEATKVAASATKTAAETAVKVAESKPPEQSKQGTPRAQSTPQEMRDMETHPKNPETHPVSPDPHDPTKPGKPKPPNPHPDRPEHPSPKPFKPDGPAKKEK